MLGSTQTTTPTPSPLHSAATTPVVSAKKRSLEPLGEELRDRDMKKMKAKRRFSPDAKQQQPLKSIEDFSLELTEMKNKMLNAIPYSKHGDGRDDYTFHRIKPHLDEIRKSLCHYIARLSIQEESWMMAFRLCEFLSAFTRDLPEFNQHRFNEYKLKILQRISSLYMQIVSAFRVEDLVPRNIEYLESGARGLEEFVQAHPQIFHVVVDAYKRKVGWTQ